MMKITALVILVIAQFTVVPFIHAVSHNKAPHISANYSIAYKNG